jgi:hypothetical protein
MTPNREMYGLTTEGRSDDAGSRDLETVTVPPLSIVSPLAGISAQAENPSGSGEK